MPDRKQYLREYSARYHANRKDEIAQRRLYKRIAEGSRPKIETLERFGLTQADVDKARAITNTKAAPRVAPPIPGADYTIEDVRECLEDAVEKTKITDTTASNYIRKLTKISEWLNCGADIVKCLENPAEVIAAINENIPGPKKDYYSAIVSIARHCPRIRHALSENGSLAIYKGEMDKGLKTAEKKRAEDTNKTVRDWKDIMKEPPRVKAVFGEDSAEHLVAQLYTAIPPMRDDFGRVWINPKINKKFNPKSRELLEKNPARMPAEAKGVLYYNNNTAIIVLHRYKTKKTYGRTTLLLPNSLQKSIIRSLSKHPREWLIENSFGGPAGALSAKIKTLFGGTTINGLRHSYITYTMRDLGQLSATQREKLARRMKHSVFIQSLYVREVDVQKQLREDLKEV